MSSQSQNQDTEQEFSQKPEEINKVVKVDEKDREVKIDEESGKENTHITNSESQPGPKKTCSTYFSGIYVFYTILIALAAVFLTYSSGFHEVAKALNEMHEFFMKILPNKDVIPDETLRIFVLKTNETIPENLMERVKKLELNKFTMFSKAVCLSGEDTDVLKVGMDRAMNKRSRNIV